MLDRFRSLNLFAKLGLILVALILIAILSLIGYTKYIDHQLKETANSINVPKSWELKETELSGNVSCLDACRSYTQIFESTDLNIEHVKSLDLPSQEKFTCIEFLQLDECSDVVVGDDYYFRLNIKAVGERHIIAFSTRHD